jgi:hypothetical protein
MDLAARACQLPANKKNGFQEFRILYIVGRESMPVAPCRIISRSVSFSLRVSLFSVLNGTDAMGDRASCRESCRGACRGSRGS